MTHHELDNNWYQVPISFLELVYVYGDYHSLEVVELGYILQVIDAGGSLVTPLLPAFT